MSAGLKTPTVFLFTDNEIKEEGASWFFLFAKKGEGTCMLGLLLVHVCLCLCLTLCQSLCLCIVCFFC